MKVIFHVDEIEKWGTALTNIKNFIDYCEKEQEEREIELLANGVAVKMLVAEAANGTGMEADLNLIAEKKVTVAACNNALNSFKIDKDSLLPFVTVVPAGVVELVKRQEQGFAYIKP